MARNIWIRRKVKLLLIVEMLLRPMLHNSYEQLFFLLIHLNLMRCPLPHRHCQMCRCACVDFDFEILHDSLQRHVCGWVSAQRARGEMRGYGPGVDWTTELTNRRWQLRYYYCSTSAVREKDFNVPAMIATAWAYRYKLTIYSLQFQFVYWHRSKQNANDETKYCTFSYSIGITLSRERAKWPREQQKSVNFYASNIYIGGARPAWRLSLLLL